MRRRLAVVTGGAGFLGSHLCERLLLEGFAVTCLDNYCTGNPANIVGLSELGQFSALRHDVTQRVPITEPVDVVLHLASPASPVDYARLPVETLTTGATGTLNCLEFAKENRARFILASTSEVYGEPQVHPQPESYWGNVNPIGPRSVYDEAKRYAEALTMAYRHRYHVDTGIVRIFNCYGPRMRPQDGRAIPTFVWQALQGMPLTVTGDGQQTRSACYVDDLVTGLIRMIGAAVPGPVNLGNPEEISIFDLAHRIRALTGSDSTITFVRRPVDEPTFRQPDISQARHLLGWTPWVSLDDGLTRTITWLRELLDADVPPAHEALRAGGTA